MTPTTETAPDSARSKRSLIIKLGVVAAALGITAYFALRGNPETQQIDTPESAAPYICLADGHVFTLTPAAYERLAKTGGIKAVNEEGRRGDRMLRCPKCGQFKAVGGARCPKDGTVVPVWTPDGLPPKCPKCGDPIER